VEVDSQLPLRSASHVSAPYGFLVRSVRSCLCVGLVCGVVKISAPFVGVGSLLVHNILKRNIKENDSIQTLICSRTDTGI
jgi:hypothetical protein